MKRLLFVAGIIGVVLLPLAAPTQEEGGAPGVTRRAEWINISGNLKQGQEPAVYPSNINVDRGAKVLWSNGSDTPARIKLGRGTQCRELTQAQLVRYQWALLGCVVTTTVAPKAVIEMFPDEGGVFGWEIEFIGTAKKLSGVLKIF